MDQQLKRGRGVHVREETREWVSWPCRRRAVNGKACVFTRLKEWDIFAHKRDTKCPEPPRRDIETSEPAIGEVSAASWFYGDKRFRGRANVSSFAKKRGIFWTWDMGALVKNRASVAESVAKCCIDSCERDREKIALKWRFVCKRRLMARYYHAPQAFAEIACRSVTPLRGTPPTPV